MLEIKKIKSSAMMKLQEPGVYETVVVMPSVDMALAGKASEVMKRRTHCSGLLLVVEDDLRLGFIMVANLVYMKTNSHYFAYVAQDAFPSEHWLDSGLDTLQQSRKGLLAFNDGRWFGTLAAFGLADRQWLKTVYGKFLFYPKYKSHYADTELSVIATLTEKLVFNPSSIVMEVDYEKHQRPNNQDDERLYGERAATGFDNRVAPFTALYT